jgi:hypothetical protein
MENKWDQPIECIVTVGLMQKSLLVAADACS